MKKIDILENSYKNMIDFYLKSASKEFLKAKKEVFTKGIDSIYDERGFLDWVICDEKINYSKIANDENKNLISAIQKSYFSIFEVISSENNLFIKDIFTKEDFKIINEDEIKDGFIIVGRIISIENEENYLKIFAEYDIELKGNFYNAILQKYNESFKEKKGYDIKEFIKEAPIAIYKFTNIYDDILSAKDNDDEYFVYQGEYLFVNRKEILDILNQNKNLEFVENFEDQFIYNIYTNKVSYNEIVVLKNKIEVESDSIEKLEILKKKLETILGDKISHIKDVKLFIEDLL